MTNAKGEFECPSCGFWESPDHVFPAKGKKRPCEIEADEPAAPDNPDPDFWTEDPASIQQPWLEIHGGEGIEPAEGTPG